MGILKGAKNKTLKIAFLSNTCACHKGATNLTLSYLGINPKRKSWWPLLSRLPQRKGDSGSQGPSGLSESGHSTPLMGSLETSPCRCLSVTPNIPLGETVQPMAGPTSSRSPILFMWLNPKKDLKRAKRTEELFVLQTTDPRLIKTRAKFWSILVISRKLYLLTESCISAYLHCPINIDYGL